MAKAAQAEAPAEQVPFKVAKTKSPNNPIYNLETALTKAKLLYDAYKLHQVPIKAAIEKLGFKSVDSSTATQAVAALKSYELIDIQGKADGRKVSVTEDAAKIIAKHPSAPQLIQKAALAPKIHVEMRDRFVGNDGIAPDEAIKHYLCFDRVDAKFNDQTVDQFIRQFKATFEFAGLDKPDNISAESTEFVDPTVEVGDFVQWESQGALQFTEPQQVTSKSLDGKWVFVAASPTGLPIKQVHRVEPKEKAASLMSQASNATVAPPANPAFKPLPPSADVKQYTYTLDNGDAVLRWPDGLSEEDYLGIETWLDSMKAKIKRSVKSEAPGS